MNELKTSRGYELDGPDNDGEMEVMHVSKQFHDIVATMWFTREDLELMLELFEDKK